MGIEKQRVSISEFETNMNQMGNGEGDGWIFIRHVIKLSRPIKVFFDVQS